MLVHPSSSGFGIYVHFPWCLKKCPYCDFFSVAVPSTEGRTSTAKEARNWLPHDEYASAVISEYDLRLLQLDAPHQPLHSIFFGGGTPSLWAASSLGRVLAHIKDTYPGEIHQDLEVTVECNPTSLDEGQIAALLASGVNRLSVGVQNLDPGRLSFLGRLHNPDEALAAVRCALQNDALRVSGDIIYGIYSQGPEQAVRDALSLADTGVSHLSAYCLTIEENTRFGALHALNKLPLLDEALAAESYSAVAQALEERGLRHYEVSNFARPGSESVHNLGYWLGRDYLGIGAGAFGTVTAQGERLRYRNLLATERYMQSWLGMRPPSDGDTEAFSQFVSDREVITPAMADQESLMLGLRTIFGIDLHHLHERSGRAPFDHKRQAQIERLVDQGSLIREGSRLRIPKEKWLFADGITRNLI